MVDDIKDRDNKDAEESGRPVQLDREEQGGKKDQPEDMEHGGRTPGQQQGQNR